MATGSGYLRNRDYSTLGLRDYFVILHGVIRLSNDLFNTNVIRFLSRSPESNAESILACSRYSSYRDSIYHLESRREFSGYWIVRNSFTEPKAPSASDVTILYLHGGGYICSTPAHYLLFLLRIAESMVDDGVSVSIFALEHHFAPEKSYPTQLGEAAAAYKYIVHEQQVAPEKVVVAGDSAGGHLALSLLVHLNKPMQSIPPENSGLAKPGGLVLLSPWLSIHLESSSYTTKVYTDILGPSFVRRCANEFYRQRLKPFKDGQECNRNSPYLDFLTPVPSIDWKAVLPSRVWAYAGDDEIFSEHIETWVASVEEVMPKDSVKLNIGFEREHDWQYIETMMDANQKKLFLGGGVGDGKGFEEAAEIGGDIAEGMRSYKGTKMRGTASTRKSIRNKITR
ncbi:MAG: hypothetical protein Q9170_006096 [Blastenia crenularia]